MIELIQKRLNVYKATNPVEEEQATKEIIQEIALYALWRADFFDIAAFQGGASLRILHDLPRFSEDLYFMLKEPDPEFDWSGYLKALLACFEEFGLSPEALPKGRMDNRVRKAIIKDSSVAHQLNLSFYRGQENQKLKIKLEIDVEPPADSGYEYTYLDFPLDYEVCHQDLSSNFSLKIHALLCRGYLKGRDWYDFNWYVKQGVSVNVLHLENALYQYGPWKDDNDISIDLTWLQQVLNNEIEGIDWKLAASDVERFLNAAEQKSLSLWSEHFFKQRVNELR
jgi:Nucleotidyl transferase AbiEii toxin, Type IV TA system